MILTFWQWIFGALGAVLVGLGKGGLPGVGNLTAAIYANIFPSKESVGILLPVLISADIVAVIVYRRHALWRYMWKLAPWTAGGIFMGFLAMDRMGNREVRLLIGSILLGMTVLHFIRKWHRRNKEDEEDRMPHSLGFQAFTGLMAGFSTMVANAAGPVAALYLLSVRLPKMSFIGTGAWFFFLVNLYKIPGQIALDNINFSSMGVSLSMIPFAMAGALIAPFLVKKINQKVFEYLIWFFVIVAGIKLFF